MRHKILSTVSCLIFGVLFSCGEDKSNRKTNDYTQEEDQAQLTNQQMFSLTDTAMPSSISPIKSSETAIDFISLSDMFYNPYFESRNHLSVGLNVKVAQRWVLQDQVDYDQKTKSLIFKDRRKYLAQIEEKYTGYVYQETFQSKRCVNDDLSVFAGMTHEQVVKKLRSENRSLCPNSSLENLTQSKTMYKFETDNGINVKYFVETAEMLPDHKHCKTIAVDEETLSMTCGNYFHTYQIEEKDGQTAVGHIYYMKSLGKDLTFKPGKMSHYLTGTFDFLVNNWAGIVEYEATGLHPKVTVQNIVNNEIGQRQF